MLNYWNRTVEPMIEAVVEGMRRRFLSRTARTQKQSVEYFRDPFKLVALGTIADLADKFARNEVVSSNEIRQKIGMKPSNDPKADQLVNSNMPEGTIGEPEVLEEEEDPEAVVQAAFDPFDAEIDALYAELGISER